LGLQQSPKDLGLTQVRGFYFGKIIVRYQSNL